MRKTLAQILNERVLLLDGAMGTEIFKKNPTLDDYGGVQFDGCVEIFNERRPEWIQDIHHSYFLAGADAVETNTFGCNKIVLSEFNLAHKTYELNKIAAQNAKRVAQSFSTEKFVIGSVGPGTKLITLLHVDYATLFASYLEQMRGLIDGHVDALLIETCQDINQIKIAVRAAKRACVERQIKLPIWVQVTIETTGTMLVGSDILTALTSIEMLGIDAFGMNCATGPDEMRPHLATLSELSPFLLSLMPNAGLPQNKDGKTFYPLGPDLFAQKVFGLAKDFSLNIVGGCCGTTPDHIRALADLVLHLPYSKPKAKLETSISSLYTSVPLNLEPKPLFVGERTNANGSKKFKDLLAQNNYDKLADIARDQQKEGAHILDVCVAYVSRNEVRDMEEFLKKIVTKIDLPIMIDSTEIPVIEKALEIAPGKCIINSINFEDGEEKARKILNLSREFGASVVALTIDEHGMAKTCENKIEITKRLVNLFVNEYKINIENLIIDPLTFTLGSGDEEFRHSAIETLNAISEIKKLFPGIKTILGLSNVSFGLSPYTRQMLNSMMLYHAVKRGLDLAILNAAKIIPVAKIDSKDKILFENLIFNQRVDGKDPLKLILEKFSGVKIDANKDLNREKLSIEEKLKQDIIDGEKKWIEIDCLQALKIYKPLDILNDILLVGMKVVGERFGSGEMQLPFVLESAEVMKIAVKILEPHMEKTQEFSKGKIVLATVKGDVHDIGKNLVEIILSNNGYTVVNLGIKQPIETIVKSAHESDADAIGMSGLLVKSTVIMKENLQYMAAQSIQFPVILGGAALTRDFVENECNNIHNGPVMYAFDAFEGLKIMNGVMQLKQEKNTVNVSYIKEKMGYQQPINQKENQDGPIKILRKGVPKTELNQWGQSSWVDAQAPVYTPPFLGTKIFECELKNVFEFLDTFALIRSRWGFVQGTQTQEKFEQVLEQKANPIYHKLKMECLNSEKIKQKAVYGYFPVNSFKNKILIYDPIHFSNKNFSKKVVLAEIEFPRQKNGRLLCIADFFKHVDSGTVDYMAIQLVTMGNEFSEWTTSIYNESKFSDYYYLHGLGTELTEAFAELLHKKIRSEFGIDNRDAKNIRQLFSQGYQGSRYSFGYPACPDMEPNEILLNLLNSSRIGVILSESFQMQPELSTSALVCTHHQARYFSC